MEEYPKIRILQVIGRMNYGGAETLLMSIYRNIDKNRVQFDFVYHTNEGCLFDNEIIKLGGRIYHCPQYKGYNILSYRKWWHEFFNTHGHYDIVHGHQRSTASIYLKIAKHYNCVTIAHSHSTTSRGNRIEKIVKYLMQLRIRNTADWFMACSPEAGKWLFGKKVVNSDHFIWIKNGIDLSKFDYNRRVREDVRRLINIEDNIVFGHVGSFTEEKNHIFLIEVFNEICKIEKKAVLLLIGDGKLRPEISKKVDEMGLKSKVHFLGTRKDIPELLDAMDCFIFPSKKEGFGIATLEAQAMGLPVIASDNLPKEVILSTNMKCIPLNKNKEEWAKISLTIAKKSQRINQTKILKEAGYDICDVAKYLGTFYAEVIPYK
jgi:glycosyltransferase involved in cell wall biosynthesis